MYHKMWNPKSSLFLSSTISILFPRSLTTNKNLVPLLEQLLHEIKTSTQPFTAEHFNSLCISIHSKNSSVIPHGKFFTCVRYVLTGTNIGAGVPQTASTLGKSKVIKRLERALEELQKTTS